MTRSSSNNTWIKIQSLLNTINHIFIGLVGIYITVLGKNLDFKDTAMHAFMTTIGYHVLMAEALMSHYKVNPITNRFSHRNKSRIHGILQFLGGSMALLGALGKISATENDHFSTLHGKVGLAATFMCTVSILGGLVNFFQPKFAHKIYSPAEIKYRHNLFGMLTFSLGMAAVLLGYRTLFFWKYNDAEFVRVISLASVLVYCLTLIAPVLSLLDKIKLRKAHKQDI
ncbi:uncharacterized protein LOC119687821 [Teleopsis dalmanni]|uniref:uncharacterized protein LOC119687821 n=1 Tax=Teleopsis dalmanni TaxID=139649 RepID=UPI000D32A993|nr:uncharacterized protein LOC119687821 [Teleopsis dalmanni]